MTAEREMQDDDAIEAEFTTDAPRPIERALVQLPPTPTVSLVGGIEHALADWQAYQELTQKLLNKTDYQKIGQRQFKKKSAWRKYARAFNITDRVTYEEIHRADDGFPLWARIRVEARHPNGRTAEADHECHVTERCCPAAAGNACRMREWKGHFCCTSSCTGRVHFSHPGDLPATALTRAKNRAIADLIGAGEVSAEEASEDDAHGESGAPARPAAKRAPAKAAPAKSAPPREPGSPSQPQLKKLHAVLGSIKKLDEKRWEDIGDQLCRRYPNAIENDVLHYSRLTAEQVSKVIDNLTKEEAKLKQRGEAAA